MSLRMLAVLAMVAAESLRERSDWHTIDASTVCGECGGVIAKGELARIAQDHNRHGYFTYFCELCGGAQ